MRDVNSQMIFLSHPSADLQVILFCFMNSQSPEKDKKLRRYIIYQTLEKLVMLTTKICVTIFIDVNSGVVVFPFYI